MNVFEILKDCPAGMKLYSTVFGEMELVKVWLDAKKIVCTDPSHVLERHFNADGKYDSLGEICLFPSKIDRDWNNFKIPLMPKFKVGDRIIWSRGTKVYVVIEMTDSCYILNNGSILQFESQDEWILDPSKFDVSQLEPFSKVLARDFGDNWKCGLFSHIDKDSDYPFYAVGSCYTQCIPYNNETKHLIGTSEDCPDYYKTWEQ